MHAFFLGMLFRHQIGKRTCPRTDERQEINSDGTDGWTAGGKLLRDAHPHGRTQTERALPEQSPIGFVLLM